MLVAYPYYLMLHTVGLKKASNMDVPRKVAKIHYKHLRQRDL